VAEPSRLCLTVRRPPSHGKATASHKGRLQSPKDRKSIGLRPYRPCQQPDSSHSRRRAARRPRAPVIRRHATQGLIRGSSLRTRRADPSSPHSPGDSRRRCQGPSRHRSGHRRPCRRHHTRDPPPARHSAGAARAKEAGGFSSKCCAGRSATGPQEAHDRTAPLHADRTSVVGAGSGAGSAEGPTPVLSEPTTSVRRPRRGPAASCCAAIPVRRQTSGNSTGLILRSAAPGEPCLTTGRGTSHGIIWGV
jgi:hypothetical protein